MQVKYAAKIDSTLIAGVTSQSISPGIQTRGDATDGTLYQRSTSVASLSPTAEFTTQSINAALAAIGLGVDIGTLAGGLGVELYAQETTSTSRAGTLAHRKYAFADGLIVPRTLTCDHQGDATLTVAILPIGDASNAPMAETDSVTLGSIAAHDVFTLGDLTLESIAMAKLKSLSIDFGIDAQLETWASSLWPREAWINTIKPVITFTCMDVTMLGSTKIPLTGLSVSHANTTASLRKRANHATLVADGTAEHVKFTACGLAIVAAAYEDGQPATLSGRVECDYDGTNAPLIINTATALA